MLSAIVFESHFGVGARHAAPRRVGHHSEETGLISFVRRGRIKRALDPTRLRAAIYKAVERETLQKKQAIDPHATESTEAESVT